MIIIIMKSSPRPYFIFIFSLTIMTFILFPSHFHPSAFGFHTASTANVTIQTGEGASDANNQSLPFGTVTEIYNSTNKALQALSEGNTSEVENQLNFTKERLSFVISNNESNQQLQEANTTQTVARPDRALNMDASGDTDIESREDIVAVETDARDNNQGLRGSETPEMLEERR